MKLALLLSLASVASGVPAQRGSYNLLTLDPSVDTSTFPNCQEPTIISCVAATVNWDALKNPEQNTIILPSGDEMFESAYIPQYGSEHHDYLGELPLSFQYKNDEGSEAVLTYKGNSLYGDIDLADGGDYVIEKHNDEYVLWIEVDQSKEDDEISIDQPESRTLPHMRMEELVAQGRADDTTVVEVSVTVYYTADFKRQTDDVEAFVAQAIAQANAGYMNSNIPMRLKLHCLIPSSVADGLEASWSLPRFTRSMGRDNYNLLRRSADTTVLLVSWFEGGGCGVSEINQISSGKTIAVVRKFCVRQYSFGHEIGHGFGLNHDRGDTRYSSTPYAFGYIIKKGTYSPYKTGYRTIMAYNQFNEKRINYYSNPSVSFEGLPTGTADTDNARVLKDNRFAAANIGDESMSCPAKYEGPCQDELDDCYQLNKQGGCGDPATAASCPVSCALCGV
jgi:hypothetical protein